MTLTTNLLPGRKGLAIHILLILALLVLGMATASAQEVIVGGTVGQGAWNSVKALWFGPAGLVLGAGIFSLACYFYFKDGVLSVLGVLVIGTIFFFVPAIVTALQAWAKTV